MDLLKTKDLLITLPDGTEKTFVLSKIPAIPAREIVTQYPISAMPKLGDYKVNEQIMMNLLSYVGVTVGDKVIRLNTPQLINNHCADWEVLARVEMAMIEYNVSFFQNGGASTFFEVIAKKAKQLISQTLTDLQARSSPPTAPPSSN